MENTNSDLENQNIDSENQTNNSENTELKSTFTIREMLEAGVHFGHRTARWNAKMAPYIYGVKNELHIIDLSQTSHLLREAVKILQEVVKRNGKILFVCTKKQGSETVKKVATETNQYYVVNKWLGGMLTNWKTIANSIKTLKGIEKELANPESTLTKKEKLLLDRKREKLETQLGGIKEMQKLPDLIFVIDTIKEALAISEAKSLDIPVMAIIDTNSNPDLINYPIPGNDDSIKAIDLYMRVINASLQEALKNVKKDSGIKEKVVEKNKKFQSKKASKNIGKKTSIVKKTEKVPAPKKEKLPAEKKEKPVATKEELKTPTIKE